MTRAALSHQTPFLVYSRHCLNIYASRWGHSWCCYCHVSVSIYVCFLLFFFFLFLCLFEFFFIFYTWLIWYQEIRKTLSPIHAWVRVIPLMDKYQVEDLNSRLFLRDLWDCLNQFGCAVPLGTITPWSSTTRSCLEGGIDSLHLSRPLACSISRSWDCWGGPKPF